MYVYAYTVNRGIPRVHIRRRRREYLSAKKLFLKYKGHQTYFCVAPCQVVLLNLYAGALCTSKRAIAGRPVY